MPDGEGTFTAMESDSFPELDNLYGMTAEEMRECQEHLMIGGGTRGGPVLHHGKGVPRVGSGWQGVH